MPIRQIGKRPRIFEPSGYELNRLNKQTNVLDIRLKMIKQKKI